jgi:FkbM family methyltransferase
MRGANSVARVVASDPRLGRFPDMEASLVALRDLGLNVNTCLDIGAYEGEWTDMFRRIFPKARVLMIEPQRTKESILRAKAAASRGRVDFEMALLGAISKPEVIFFEMETGSSLLPELTGHARNAVGIPLTTLDDSVQKRWATANVDFIKLDTQGYELEIMKGGLKTLGRAKAVLTEASVQPFNEGAPRAAEVISFLKANGFELFDFCSQMRRSDGVLWQTDLLFLREGTLVEALSRIEESPARDLTWFL